MLKILFFIDTLQTGGAEKSILEICKRMKKCKPVVCTLFNSNETLIPQFKSAGIEVVEIGISKKDRLWLIKAVSKYRDVLKKTKPDLVHAHLFKAEITARLATPKSIPLIGAFVNDSYSTDRYIGQKPFQSFILNIYKYIDRITAGKAFHYTSVSHSIMETNCQALHLNPQKVTVIYRGREKEKFNTTIPEYEKGKDIFRFVVVARLLKRKGYMELIKAASILKQKSDLPFIINIAGKGVDKNEIKAYSSNLKMNENVNFLGSSNEVPRLLSESHCFIFPSHYEGQGGALVEAMFSARPIIATDIPVFKEQVSDGESALLFTIRDAEELSSKMLWVMNNYQQATVLGKNARRKAEEMFDIENIAGIHDDFYLNINQQFKNDQH